MTVSIRDLTDADLDAADAILNLAFQSTASHLNELRLYRRLQPDGLVVASQEGNLVGMVGAVSYGTMAHIGLMAVHPEYQRQGIGLVLMQFILTWLEQQHVPVVVLDASKKGRPLYEKLGFVAYDETLVYEGPSKPIKGERPSHIQPISRRDLDELVEWDADIFGAERRKVFEVLLEVNPSRAFLKRDGGGKLAGYLFAQRNRIGPWVMLTSDGGEDLLEAAISLPYDGMISAAVPAENKNAIGLLETNGFRLIRTNRHMGKGSSTAPGKRERICAQTSLAAG
jgi:predicted N-acetyltransferase YhbS